MTSHYSSLQVTSVGWKALLEWVNDLLKVQLTQVEQCASGAVYCQVLHSCYPDTVEMSKVNWMAKADHEYIPNYKILQNAFDINGIDRPFPVGELIRGKFRDNFEMLQWMKVLWDRVGTRRVYEPSKPREGKQLPRWAQGFLFGPTPRTSSKSPSRRQVGRIPTPCRAAPVVAKVDTWRSAEPASCSMSRSRSGLQLDLSAAKVVPSMPTSPVPSMPTSPRTLAPSMPTSVASVASLASTCHMLRSSSDSQEPELKQRVAVQEDEINLLRQERDFYFEKLRSAESLCKSFTSKSDDLHTHPVVKQLQQILYKEREEPEQVVTFVGSDHYFLPVKGAASTLKS